MALPVDHPSLTDGTCVHGHSIAEFGCMRNDPRKTNLVRDCRACQSNYRMKHRYGITLDEFNLMLAEQNNRCLICDKVFSSDNLKDKPYIDHDHSCCPGARTCGNCVRGILCMRCNTVLGLVEDSADILLSAANFVGGV